MLVQTVTGATKATAVAATHNALALTGEAAGLAYQQHSRGAHAYGHPSCPPEKQRPATFLLDQSHCQQLTTEVCKPCGGSAEQLAERERRRKSASKRQNPVVVHSKTRWVRCSATPSARATHSVVDLGVFEDCRSEVKNGIDAGRLLQNLQTNSQKQTGRVQLCTSKNLATLFVS